jgi:putative tryptophan/tyrosine transport system substrate-binding protein
VAARGAGAAANEARVGVLTPAATDATPIFDGFCRGLRDLGYIEGTTIILDFRFAKGNLDALPALAKNLVNSPIDVIVTDGTSATRAALDATRTVPIVMGVAADALEAGLVTSTARPGGNVTGMTLGRIERAGKRGRATVDCKKRRAGAIDCT